jgi:single-strand DNA-binding protein
MSVDVASERPSNLVRLYGRVAADPVVRELPSGDLMATCRLVVARSEAERRNGSRRGPTVDVIDLVAWTGRARQTVGRWRVGDEVTIEGALRRRFFRLGGRTESRVEVEVSSGRRIRRGATG